MGSQFRCQLRDRTRVEDIENYPGERAGQGGMGTMKEGYGLH